MSQFNIARDAIHSSDYGPGTLFRSRAAIIRTISFKGHLDFAVDGNIAAASVRGSAYQISGRGFFRCERIAHNLVRVWRVKQ